MPGFKLGLQPSEIDAIIDAARSERLVAGRDTGERGNAAAGDGAAQHFVPPLGVGAEVIKRERPRAALLAA